MRQTCFNRLLAPGEVGTASFLGFAFLDRLRELDERFAGPRMAIEHHVLDLRAQRGLEVVVDADHAGIDDAHAHSSLHRVVEEDGVDRLAHRIVAAEREGDVGDAARNLRVRQVGANPARGFDEVDGVVVVLGDAGGDGEDVRVEDDVFGRETGSALLRRCRQQGIGAGANLGLARESVGLPLLIEGHDHHRGAVTAGEAGLFEEFGLAFLHRNRVDDALALDALEAGLNDVPFRRIEHHRHARDVGFGGDQLEEAVHRRQPVEHCLVHVDVDHLGAVLDLVPRNRQRVVVAAFEDHPREDTRTGDVGPLADVHEQRLRPDVEGFEAGQAQLFLDRRQGARYDAVDGTGDRRDVFGRGAAATAEDVHIPLARPVGDFAGQLLGRLVIAAEGIGQAGVGVGRDVAITDARQLLDVLAQLRRTERAIEAEGQRPDVAQRIPEGFGGLPRERAPRGVGDRARDHHRPAAAGAFEELFEGEERRLGIERVEDRLDQQQVGAAIGQAANGFVVGGDQFVETDVAVARIVHVGRDRRGARGRAQHAGDEARLGRRLRRKFVAHLARQACTGEVQFVDDGFEPVIGLRDCRRVEGVGFEDVGTGREVFGVDAANHIGSGEQQEVVVALDVVRVRGKALAAVIGLLQAVALDHRPHRPVEDKHALRKQLGELGRAVGLKAGHQGRRGHGEPQNEKTRSAATANGFREWGSGMLDRARLHARFSRTCNAPAS